MLMNVTNIGATVLSCRVVCQGLTDYQAPLHDVITPLLDIIEAHPLPSAEAVSAVFFSVSTLVRLSSTPALASAILSTGRLAVVVDALNVAPSSICQVRDLLLGCEGGTELGQSTSRTTGVQQGTNKLRARPLVFSCLVCWCLSLAAL